MPAHLYRGGGGAARLDDARHGRGALTADALAVAGWFAETPPAHPRVPQVVPQVEQFMLQHLAEPITMATLAQHAGYCPRHLARLFRAQTGLSPMAYLLQLRMRQVCLLLRETDLKLSAIGARVGIANVAYFCALFKRRFGMTPSQYRTDVGA